MGFWDFDGASVVSRRSSHHHSSSGHHKSSHRKGHSPSRQHHTSASIFGGDGEHREHGEHHKRSSSRSGFFGLPNVSSRNFFGFGRSSSYYKRSSRPSFLSRAYKKLKRLLRDLMYYAQRHPLKVFMLVVMPLVTGGALTALLARFGLRLPPGLERMLGLGARAVSGDGIGLVGEAVRMASSGGLARGPGSVSIARGREGNFQWERRSVDRPGESWGGIAGGLGSVAKMFI